MMLVVVTRLSWSKIVREFAAFALASAFIFCAPLVSAAEPLVNNAQVAKPTPLQYFGLVMHDLDSGSPWPPFKFGTWRLWDAGVDWAQLEPSPGNWQFKRLDHYVDVAQTRGVEVIYPLGLCAPWASARPSERSGYQPGYAAEPADMENWRHYVQTVAERYKGRIKYYEVWNEPSDEKYFTGSPEKLLEMMKIAYETLKKVDPEIKVVSPGVTIGTGQEKYLDHLLAIGGKNYVDIIGYHFYLWKWYPEALAPWVRNVRDVMRKNGISDKPLWNTEAGWWIGNTDGTPDSPMVAQPKGAWKKLDPSEAGAVLARAFLIARSEGIDRYVWYSWDNKYGLGMREPTSGATKAMAKQYEYIVEAMTGWAVSGCAESSEVWSCKMDKLGESSKLVAWVPTGPKMWRLPDSPKFAWMRSLETNTEKPVVNNEILLGQFPIIFR